MESGQELDEVGLVNKFAHLHMTTDPVALKQAQCGHVFIANGQDPICVHCGINESQANGMKKAEEKPQKSLIYSGWQHPWRI